MAYTKDDYEKYMSENIDRSNSGIYANHAKALRDYTQSRVNFLNNRKKQEEEIAARNEAIAMAQRNARLQNIVSNPVGHRMDIAKNAEISDRLKSQAATPTKVDLPKIPMDNFPYSAYQDGKDISTDIEDSKKRLTDYRNKSLTAKSREERAHAEQRAQSEELYLKNLNDRYDKYRYSGNINKLKQELNDAKKRADDYTVKQNSFYGNAGIAEAGAGEEGSKYFYDEAKRYESLAAQEKEKVNLLQQKLMGSIAYQMQNQDDFDANSAYNPNADRADAYESQYQIYQVINGGDYKKSISDPTQVGAQYMTDEEKKIFNYLYNTKNADLAMTYFNGLNLTQRMSEATARDARNFAYTNPVLSSAKSVPLGVGSAFGALENLMSDVIYGDFDENASWNQASIERTQIRDTVANDIKKDVLNKTNSSLISNGAAFLYQTGMSGADNIFQLAVTGGNETASLALMGLTAAQDTFTQKIGEGSDKRTALTYGLASGIVELITEKIGLDELFSTKDLKKFLNGKEFAQAIAKQAAAEGSEEMLSEVLDTALDIAMYADKSEFMMNVNSYMEKGLDQKEAYARAYMDLLVQVGVAGLGGALSGAAMGTAFTGANQFSNRSQVNKTSTNVESSGLSDNIKELAKEREGSIASQIADERGEDALTRHDISEITKEAIENDDKEMLDAIGFDSKIGEIVKANEKAEAKEDQRINKEYRQYEKTGEARRIDISRNAVVDGENVEVDGIAKNGRYYVKNSGAVDANLVQFEDNVTNDLYKGLAEIEDVGLANKALANYSGAVDADTYAMGVRFAYEAGLLSEKTGVTAANYVKGKQSLTVRQMVFNDALVKEAYEAGAEVAKQNAAEVRAIPAEKKSNYKVLIEKANNAIAENDDLSFIEAVVSYSTQQLIEETENIQNGVRGLRTADAIGKVLLNKNGSNKYQTMIHESIMEKMKAESPEDYNNVVKAVVEYMQSDRKRIKSFSDSLANYKVAYEKATNKEAAMQDMVDEYVNDFVSGIFSTDKGVQDFCEHIVKANTKSKAQKILQSLANVLERMVNAIKNYLSGKNLSDMNGAAKAGFKANIKDVEHIRNMVLQYTDARGVEMAADEFTDAIKDERTVAEITNEEVYEEAISEAKEVEKFSLDVPMEQTKDLLAVHNLGEQQLIDSLKLGGFPAPSIAIIRMGMIHDKYGAISVLFDKDTIDPKRSNRNKVYGGDAWTPVFPSIEYKANTDRVYEIWDKVDSLVPKEVQKAEYSGFDSSNVEDFLNRNNGDIVKAYKDRLAFKYMFLVDKEGLGQTVLELPMKNESLSNKYSNHIIEKVAALFTNEEILNIFQNASEKIKDENLVDKVKTAVNEAYAEEHADKIKGDSKLAKMFKNMYEMNFSQFDTLFYDLNKYAKNGRQAKRTVDPHALKDSVNKFIEGHEAEYEKYLKNVFEGIVEKTGIRNNKDVFTNSGNRRSWEQLHDEATLENIAKVMGDQYTKGAAGFFAQSAIQAIATKDFKSIEDIRKSKGQLRTIDEEEYKKLRDGFSDRFSEIVSEIMPSHGSGNSFIDFDNVANGIADTIRRYKTEASIQKELSKYYPVKPDTAKKIVELMHDISELPTGYFEAKPLRAVYSDEIAKVVLPSESSKELFDLLDENGVNYETYEAGDEKARTEAVNDEELAFSVDVSEDSNENPTDGKDAIYSVNAINKRTYNYSDLPLSDVMPYVDANAYNIVIAKNGSSRDDVVKTTRDNISRYNSAKNNGLGDNMLHNKYIGDVHVPTYAIRHGLTRDYKKSVNKLAAPSLLPLYFENAVVVNEADGARNNSDFSYILFGQYVYDGVRYFTRTVVNAYTNSIESTSIYATMQKKEDSAFQNANGLSHFLSSNSTVADFINEVKYYFPDELSDDVAKKLNVSKGNSIIDNLRYSVEVDSKGGYLNEDQQNFYRDSAIRDDDGNLKVMYHVSPNVFSVFDKKRAKSGFSGRGFYFSTQPMAEYGGNVYEVYLNIKNPIDSSNGRTFTREQIRNLVDAVANDPNEEMDIYNYGSDATVDSVTDMLDKKKSDYAILSDLNASSIGDLVQAVKLFNEVNGTNYDGIVSDMETVAFYENQIKRTSNQHPTDNVDINLSVDVLSNDVFDDGLDFLFEEDDSDLYDAAQIVGEGVNILEQGEASIANAQINPEIARKVAKNIIKKTGSKYKVDQLADNITKAFAYMKDTQDTSYGVLMDIMKSIAKPVLEQAESKSTSEEWNNLRNVLKGTKISLSEEQKREVAYNYGSYDAWRKAMMGVATITNNGLPLDYVWSELVEASGYQLDAGVPDVDQPMALINLVDALRPEAQNDFGMDIERYAYDVAMDIYGQYFEMLGEEATNDKLKEYSKRLAQKQKEFEKKAKEKYEKALADAKKKAAEEKQIAIDRLKKQIADTQNGISEAQDQSNEEVQALLEAQKKSYEQKLKDLRVQNAEKVAFVKAKASVSRNQANYNRRNTVLKDRVRSAVNSMNSMLKLPNVNNHMKAQFVRPVIDMLQAINLDTGKSVRFKEKLDALQLVYDSYKNDNRFNFDYDENTSNMIKELSAMFEHRNITELTNSELETVLRIVNRMRTQIRNANRVLNSEKLNDAYKAAREIVSEIDNSYGSRMNVVTDSIDKYLSMHLNAKSWFKKTSGYKDGAFMDIYNQFNEGQLKSINIQKEVNEMFAPVLEGAENQKNVKKLTSTKKEDLVDIGLRDKNNNPVLVTRDMRLSLLMHSMNDDSMRHIFNGGLRVPELEKYANGKFKDSYIGDRSFRYITFKDQLEAAKSGNYSELERQQAQTLKTIKQMASELSDYEKAFLKIAIKFFHEYTGKQINEVSSQLKGYDVASVKNYFPIKTDPEFTRTEFAGLVRDASLEGMGMLKSRVKSSNPILLEGITNVILRQTQNVSQYAGMAIPIRNANMLMGLSFRDGDSNKSIRNSINNKWGSKNLEWLQNLMQDLQFGRAKDSTYLDALRSNFAGATLTLNPSVAIKQASSYTTAIARLDYASVAKALKDVPKGFAMQQGLKELEDINPLLWYRNQGNSTQELGDIRQKHGAFNNLPKYLNWIQFMDTGTVRTLEYASKYYVDRHISEYTFTNDEGKTEQVKPGSKEYWEAVSKVFTDVVQDTQPNYTVLQQADIIRNPNKFIKQLFMFKTQPMQNFNIMYDAIGEYSAAVRSGDKAKAKKLGKQVAKAISSQIISASVFSAMSILANLILHKHYKFREDRDKDGEKEFHNDLVLRAFGTGIADTLTGALIGGGELYDVLAAVFGGETWYGIDISSLEMVNDAVTYAQKMFKNADELGEAKTDAAREQKVRNALDAAHMLAKQIAKIAGVPADNIENILKSIILTGKDIADDEEWGTNEKILPDVKKQPDRIVDAMIDGNSTEADRLTAQSVSASTAEDPESTVASSITKEVKERFKAGEITEAEAVQLVLDAKDYKDGYTQADAYAMVQDWIYDKKYGKAHELIDNYTPSKYSQADFNKLVKEYTDNGFVEKNIIDDIKSYYKEVGNGQKDSIYYACFMMLKACGLSATEADKKLK